MRSVILLCLLTSSPLLLAQEPKPLHTCKEHVDVYCPSERDTKDIKQILGCLMKNEEKLSTECKQDIQRTAKIFQQTTPPGGGPMGMLGGMTSIGALVPMLSYEGRIIPSQNIDHKTPSVQENNLRLSIPVYRTEKDMVATTLSASQVQLGESIVLDSGLKVPSMLFRTELGLQYSHKLPEQRMYGFQGSYGYVGDEVSKENESYTVNANYSFPGKKKGHWVLMVIMSNNTPLGDGIPIPGFFYIHKTPTFTGVFGLPILSMQWTPVNPWSFSFSALGPILRSEISYGTIDKIQFFTGLSWNQQRFILSDRADDKDRLTLEEKRFEIGARRPLSKKIFAEFKGGYSFDRAVYVGQGLFDKESGEADLDASVFASWNLRLLF